MFIFWDNSNIHISGLRVMEQVEPDKPRELFRTNFNNLLQLVKKDRNIEKIYLSGSVPPPSNSVWDYLKNMGISVQLLDKTADGVEQESVDMSLQTMMLRTAIDNAANPSTIAVLTGDGAGKQLGEGFLSDLKRIKKLGWNIEVYAWEISCNRYLKEYAEQNGLQTVEKVKQKCLAFSLICGIINMVMKGAENRKTRKTSDRICMYGRADTGRPSAQKNR